MFNFYKNNDELMESRRRESIGDWYPNEAYALNDDGDRTDNPTYDASDATAWELALDIKNIKGSNNPDQLSRLYDTTDTVYDYAEARTKGPLGYKSLGEQMDMQYWDNTNGTTTWADHIQAVKTAYPKPS